uniref:Uncharacterized protein n=1 Tax=viral metagenome TaxID=1070528 RepID=A0A6C0HT52_9ZZZZ
MYKCYLYIFFYEFCYENSKKNAKKLNIYFSKIKNV